VSVASDKSQDVLEKTLSCLRQWSPSSPTTRVFRVDEHTFLKSTGFTLTEAYSMMLVRTLTTIPVPKVHYTIRQGLCSYFVMEAVDGETLEQCWPCLGWFARIRIIWTIRGYISQLRAVRHTRPGPIDDVPCKGRLFTEIGAGPFASYSSMATWFNHKLDVSKRGGRAPLDAQQFDSTWPLVFTHQDLHPRNFMLDRTGRLWIIDWEWAGFYPIWFEYSGMLRDTSSFPRFWRFFIPFIAGTFKTYPT
jgi:hypothetical protein